MTLPKLALLAALPLALAAPIADAQSPMRPIQEETVGEILALPAVANDGDAIDVAAIARHAGAVVAIVSVGGGPFGIGDREVAVPLREFAVRDDKLVLETHSDARLKTLPGVDAARYERLASSIVVGEVMAER